MGGTDANTISPIDTDQITMGSDNTVFSFYQAQTGVRSVGVFPYNGANLNMRVNKLATDDYDWAYPNDNFKFLSSNTLYQNNSTDVATLLSLAATIPNADVSNPAGDKYTGSHCRLCDNSTVYITYKPAVFIFNI